MWDPIAYGRYADERGRPFADLLNRVQAHSPATVVDLGCGPGDQTQTLLDRWPGATVVGVDSSAEMIATAAQRAIPGRLTFIDADLRDWQPVSPLDVCLSNATLQWVPDHLDLLPRIAGWLSPGGWLAFQVPGNFDAPSHTLLRALRESPPWRDRLAKAARAAAVADPATYLRALVACGLRVDAWETTYLHVLAGDDAVLEWIRGTALRPVLAALDDAEQALFIAEYAVLLRAAYPPTDFGTLLPFRRIFVVEQATGALRG